MKYSLDWLLKEFNDDFYSNWNLLKAINEVGWLGMKKGNKYAFLYLWVWCRTLAPKSLAYLRGVALGALAPQAPSLVPKASQGARLPESSP